MALVAANSQVESHETLVTAVLPEAIDFGASQTFKDGDEDRPARHESLVRNGDREWPTDGDSDSLQGDEGLAPHRLAPDRETHFVKIHGHGLVPLHAIYEGLSRHYECTCHQSRLRPDDYAFNQTSANLARKQTAESMVVEPGSGCQSTTSSENFSRTESPTPLTYSMGSRTAWLPTPVPYFTSSPLWLTPEHMAEYPYPRKLSLDGSDDDEESSFRWNRIGDRRTTSLPDSHEDVAKQRIVEDQSSEVCVRIDPHILQNSWLTTKDAVRTSDGVLKPQSLQGCSNDSNGRPSLIECHPRRLDGQDPEPADDGSSVGSNEREDRRVGIGDTVLQTHHSQRKITKLRSEEDGPNIAQEICGSANDSIEEVSYILERQGCAAPCDGVNDSRVSESTSSTFHNCTGNPGNSTWNTFQAHIRGADQGQQGDEDDDRMRKRPRKVPSNDCSGPSGFSSKAPVQIPCVEDDCPGKDNYMAGLMCVPL